MQHPDEGTIHAYLDDALSADEAREVEAHVASCEACQAGVAAARGLVAASSRIVSHLDAVPRGVIPAKAPQRSRWIFSAWPAAIAATLVIGIGLVSIRDKKNPVLPLPPAPTPGIIRAAAPESVPVARPRTVEPAPQRKVLPQRAADRNASKPVANEVAAPTVQLPAASAAAQKSAVASPPPSPAPRPDSNKRSGLALEAIVVTGAPPSGRSLAKVGGGAAGMAAGADRRTPDFSDEATRGFVACYEIGASADILPAQFALTQSGAPRGDGLAVWQVSDSRLVAPIVGLGWGAENGRAVIRKSSGELLLSLTRSGSSTTADWPSGPRAVRVISCK